MPGVPLVANVVDEADVPAVARANGVPRARRKPTAQLRILWRVSPAIPHACLHLDRTLSREAGGGALRVLGAARPVDRGQPPLKDA
jgi:hypothetical protein